MDGATVVDSAPPPRQAESIPRDDEETPHTTNGHHHDELPDGTHTPTNAESNDTNGQKGDDEGHEQQQSSDDTKFERLVAEEDSARLEIDQDNDRARLVAYIGRCVWVEDAARTSQIVPLESSERSEIMKACEASFAEALELDDLHMQLREAEKALRETETGVHAEEVLLAYLETTTAAINTAKVQQAEHDAMLTESEASRNRIRALLEAFPPAGNDRLNERLTELENAFRGQTDEGRAAEDGDDDEGQAPPATAADADESGAASARACARSALEKQWTEAPSTTTAELDALATMPALQRCDLLQDRHQRLLDRVASMYHAHEQTLRDITQGTTALTGELQTLFEKEMKALVAPRKLLQQIEDEQLHHIRRGTFVKERQVDSVTHEQLATKRVHQDHTQLCTKLVSLKADIRVVQNEVRDLKRSLEDLESGKKKTRDVLTAKLDELEKESEAFETMRLKLQEEAEDLKALRVELMKVLQFAKLQKKV